MLRRTLAAVVWIFAAGSVPPVAGDMLVRYQIEGDAIPVSLTGEPGDARRGRSIVTGRDGNCTLCHAVPDGNMRFAGNLGPPLAGVGQRLTAARLRLRVVDQTRINRDTVMPPYYRVEGLNQVARRFRGKPVLTAQEVEDVVAYLASLK